MKIIIQITMDVNLMEDFTSKDALIAELDRVKNELREQIKFKFPEQKIYTVDLINQQVDITFF